jgi:hypothetical protein
MKGTDKAKRNQAIIEDGRKMEMQCAFPSTDTVGALKLLKAKMWLSATAIELCLRLFAPTSDFRILDPSFLSLFHPQRLIDRP